jgi:hypothetical protein
LRGNSRQFGHRQIQRGKLRASIIGDSIMVPHDDAAEFAGLTPERAEELWAAVAAEVERRRKLAAEARQAVKTTAKPAKAKARATARTRRLSPREAQQIPA